MKLFSRTPLAMTFLAIFILISHSCAKDSDLFDQYVLEPEEEEVVDTDDTTDETDGEEDETTDEGDGQGNVISRPASSGGNPDWFEWNPSVEEPADGTVYTPTSRADITNSLNAGKTAVISRSFDCSGCKFAENQKIRPAGGVISGDNIDLNGAYIDDVPKQAFAPTVTFSSVYSNSWVYAEVFGAVGNDSADDSASIDALLDNVKFGKLNSNQTYIKNAPSFSDGQRDIIFDLNGSKIEVTSDSGYDEVTDQQAMFMFHGVNVKFYNGEIDGNNLFGAVFRIGHPEAYHFENLWIHNLENEPYSTSQGVRVAAFIFHLSNADGSKSWQGGLPWSSRNTTNVFQNGYINNCTIEDLNGTGTGLPSMSSQAIWYVIGGVNNTNEALAYQSNNIIRRITGGEGEGIFWNGGTGITPNHAMTLQLENETIMDCADRAIKATSSNVIVNNCYFSRINPSVGLDQLGDLVSIFTLNNFSYPTNRIKNVSITNSDFEDNYGNNSSLLSLGDVDEVTVSGNTFTQSSSGPRGAIRLGTISTNPSAQGGVDNTTIQNNIIVNGHIDLLYALSPTNLLIDNCIFNYVHTTGGNNGAAIFRHDQNTNIDASSMTISNLDINVTINGANFNGLLNANGSITGSVWKNITLDYASSYSSTNGEFLYTRGSFDNTNTMSNITMTNAVGTGSMKINGTGSPVLTNVLDNNGNPITIQ
ncbi:MAG: hypothetical protein CMH46_08960 [Muricauda sp.]|nr:hypothetical protein [Allomuricauda sp.]|tara:strand:- start:572 stop:2680 length:2109 start_codon:yes stop_codon:yes gene_type:complete